MPGNDVCSNFDYGNRTYVRVYTRLDAHLLWIAKIQYLHSDELHADIRNGANLHQILKFPFIVLILLKTGL